MRRVLGSGLATVLAVGLATAADPAQPSDPAAFDRLVREALQDVHNRGADLYNAAKDYPGAYRLYEGSLRTARPLIGHRPGSQKVIDDGLAAAEKETDPARRAFLLHEAIEQVRADLKVPAPAVKQADGKPPEPKLDPPPAKDAAGDVAGTITFKGQPVAGADVTFVSLDRPAPKVVTAATGVDGTFAAKGLPPGEYVVIVTGGKDVKLPAKYATTDTSALRAAVKAGANRLDLNLQ